MSRKINYTKLRTIVNKVKATKGTWKQIHKEFCKATGYKSSQSSLQNSYYTYAKLHGWKARPFKSLPKSEKKRNAINHDLLHSIVKKVAEKKVKKPWPLVHRLYRKATGHNSCKPQSLCSQYSKWARKNGIPSPFIKSPSPVKAVAAKKAHKPVEAPGGVTSTSTLLKPKEFDDITKCLEEISAGFDRMGQIIQNRLNTSINANVRLLDEAMQNIPILVKRQTRESFYEMMEEFTRPK